MDTYLNLPPNENNNLPQNENNIKNLQLLQELNDLLEKCYEAERGFKIAAEEVENLTLKCFFEQHSDQRYEWRHQIQEEIAKLGGRPHGVGGFFDSAHRMWVEIKETFDECDEYSILEECDKGESAVLQDYQHILNLGFLPASCKRIIKKQKKEIEDSISAIRSLEKRYRNS